MKANRNHVVGFGITIAIFIVLGLLYSQTKLFEGMEWGATDFRFWLRDPSEKTEKLSENVKKGKINDRARKDILILGIDESSLRYFSDKGIQWPFPWEIHSKFTKYVGTGGAKAIFFDIMFLDHKKDEEKLAKSIETAANVFLDYPLETESIDKPFADQPERIKLLDRLKIPLDPNDTFKALVEEAVPPTPKLTKAAKGIGFANVFPGRDQINRTVPLILKLNNGYYPNIDLMIVMHYYGLSLKDIEVKIGKYIKLKNIPVEKMAKPNPSREIIIPIDEYGMMDINFIGSTGSFQHVPYYLFVRDGDMMKEKNSSLKDKILLVAAYAATGIATDEKKSPYGAAFGIEHHANALNTILNQDFIKKLADWQNLIIMLVLAIILGFILPRFSILVGVITTLVTAVLYTITSYVLFDQLSIVTAMVTPLIQTGITFSLIVSYRVLTEQKEKKYIKQTFSKFVSKAVVDDLLKHPEKLKLGGEKKILTVLFSDIRGFTTLSEKLTPEELVEHLNVYLQSMTDVVFKYFGTLDKYVGDEIMAFWGAPIPQDDHALLACRAALEMMTELHLMNSKWEKENKPTLDIGIGLNSGDMVVGNMGSTSRMDYTLMGDNVNLGARLEGTNKVYGTKVIISEFTYELVKENIIARELDLIRVKGKELPVKIYELVDVK